MKRHTEGEAVLGQVLKLDGEGDTGAAKGADGGYGALDVADQGAVLEEGRVGQGGAVDGRGRVSGDDSGIA